MHAERRPFIGGNWKMNTDLASGVELADAVLAASVFHFGALTIEDVKAELAAHGWPVR